MAKSAYLVTVSGPDRVGVGAELFAALSSLSAQNAQLIDVGQITIRGALVLCAEVVIDDTLGPEAIRAALEGRDIEGRGISATVERATPSEVVHGGRLLVT
ncbi:MAG: ACT domain-containing protein, partial [Acidimicrobiales bacterium]